jgi:tRNA pseudouridine55 synthase
VTIPNLRKDDGVIVVNKPAGWTSHDVVSKMRGIAGTRRVGHLGTLDPMATGVLPLMIGQATRLARFWHHSEKVYEGVVRFGFATNSYDREGEVIGEVTEPIVSAGHLEACLGQFHGDILQTPPAVSAKKINGVPAYKLARQNKPVDLEPVRVSIYELRLESIDGARARLYVRCSAGTYVRTIAHELGQVLGFGAHLDSLVRLASGPFTLNQAHSLEQLQEWKNAGHLEDALITPPDLLPEFPRAFVDDLTAGHIRQGRDFSVSPFRIPSGAEYVKAVGSDGQLVAIGKIILPNLYHPMVVMPAAA